DVLAKQCGLSVEEAAVAIDATSTVSSLYASIDGDDESFTLEKIISSESNDIDRKIDHIALTQAISSLPVLWRQIITLRYLQEKSQQATAEILGLTQVKISREEKKIYEALRKKLS
ncbi:MAG: sigma-70 family RNA polymerase sigma factor, partial [Clostridia bacterium]|nr:sigma-70 family RNA polymerase sigma factor [Clostridia bacterium]